MDRDSFYLARPEKDLVDCIRSALSAEWALLRSRDCEGSFAAVASINFSPPNLSGELYVIMATNKE